MRTTFYVSIANLKMDMDTLQVGNVIFINAPEKITEQTAKKTMDKILSTRSEAENVWHYHQKQRFANHTIAIVKIEAADRKTAEIMAEQEIEHALNLLRFYLSGLSEHDPFFYRIFMGIEGTNYTGLTAFLIVNEDEKKVSLSSSRRGTLYGYEITHSVLDKMNKLHFEHVSMILRKLEKERSPFEKSLMTAIDFFGVAMNELTVRNAFVNFVIALESALLERCERHKVQKLVDKISALFLILPNKRKQLSDVVSRYYKIRSDIVHEGIDNVDEKIAFDIFSFTFKVLTQIIPYAGLIKDKEEFRKKLHEELKALNHKP